ncbi:uncharacterized protein HD556DRAFT_1308738 [Suillus plorans]|uniref:Uncharacterized protein n=1 Tax=Suillus plorans TaxID=116603 RepID=A0A9P7ANZ9_9AGAM|nr:uncharacterized protein HD556DRAFT_1308738 [Suillus plorans]KAG1793309.1 hypothetical protein HD556DRAFT_1308738 [Suillus plorans]
MAPRKGKKKATKDDDDFGTYNDRLKNNTHVNKMIASFEKNGIQWGTQTNALPIVIERSRISPGQTLEGSWTDSTTLKEVKFRDQEPLIFASGQHRVAALKKYTKRFSDEAEELQARLTHLEGEESITKEEAEEHADLRIRLGDIKGHLTKTGMWGVVLYDKVKVKVVALSHQPRADTQFVRALSKTHAGLPKGDGMSAKVHRGSQVKSKSREPKSEQSKGKPRDVTIDEPKVKESRRSRNQTKVKVERDENRRMREAKETVKLKAKRWNDEPNVKVKVKVKERGMEESRDKIMKE